TLSPALAALLLRPREKGVYQALPKVAFLLLGGWAGWEYLSPYLIQRGGSDISWAMQVVSVLIGVPIGWLLANPLNRVLGWSFALFNRGFDYSTNVFTP